MTHLMKRMLIGAALTVAPVLPAMMGSPAEASHNSSVSVSISSPNVVFGFSYGNPMLYGHVHHGPVACDAGPLYWYPSYRVYGHYHPRLRYTHYARPVYYPVRYYAGPPVYHYGPPAHAHWKKYHHKNKHGHGRHDDDDDGGRHHDDDDN